jgi:hypothetical protein
MTEEEYMKNARMRFASLAAMVIMGVVCSASPMFGQQVRLRARQNKVINGIEAELRGDFRAAANPIRLNAELDNINIPLGTKIAFCLVQNGAKKKIGVGRVKVVGGVQVAEVELSANDGAAVPSVSAGDILQARQSAVAPFRSSPGCGAPLLVAASFR